MTASGLCHCQTGLGALPASVRASLTMVAGMFFTLFRTFGTDLCAVFAYQVAKLTFTLHEVNSKATEFGTVRIQCDASSHTFGIFCFTGSRALFAHISAVLACIYTGLILFLGHEILLTLNLTR
jgi:hypothetical protein